MSVAKRSMLGLDRGQDLLAVDRAISELRAARPLLLTGAKARAVIVSANSSIRISLIVSTPSQPAGPSCPACRAPASPGLDPAQGGRHGGAATTDLGRIEQLVLKVDGRLDAPIAPATAIDLGALELAALSLILPALVVVPVDLAAVAEEPLVRVAVSAVNSFRKTQVEQLTIVGRAPVPLEDAPRTEFVVFRAAKACAIRSPSWSVSSTWASPCMCACIRPA